MANNFLNLFETKAEQDKNYITEEGHNEFPWVSLCKENNKFYYTSYIEFKDKGEVGDFYYDNGKFSTDVDINIATPIGIVVIPENFIPSSPKCRIMSLVTMDTLSPETGSNRNECIIFGNYNASIEELPLYVYGACGKMTSKVQGICDITLLPSDLYGPDYYINKPSYSGDPSTYFYYELNNSLTGYTAVSPYLIDKNGNETFNEEYIRTESPSSIYNRLSDLNGYSNTKILIQDKYTSGQTDWRTADTIYSSSGSGYMAAACCCKRFKAGNLDWYLPSAGELGFIIPRCLKLNNQLLKLQKQTNNVTLCKSHSYYSSTFNRLTDVIIDQTYDGNICSIGRNTCRCSTRAFAII